MTHTYNIEFYMIVAVVKSEVGGRDQEFRNYNFLPIYFCERYIAGGRP